MLNYVKDFQIWHVLFLSANAVDINVCYLAVRAKKYFLST